MEINHVVTGLDDFAKRRKKGTLASFLKTVAIGTAVGALGGPGFAVGGAALGGLLAFKGLNRLRQYSRHKIADKIRQDMPNMSTAEHEVLDAYTGKQSKLKGNVGTALKYAAVGSISPAAAGLMASPAAGRLGMRAVRAMGRGVRASAAESAGVAALRGWVAGQSGSGDKVSAFGDSSGTETEKE
jgi:hypothetical protein